MNASIDPWPCVWLCTPPLVSICENMRTIVSVSLSEHVSARLCINIPPVRRWDTWEGRQRQKCLTRQSSLLQCRAEEEVRRRREEEEEEEKGGGGGGGREIWNASIPLMRKASIWELRVLEVWKSDLRVKTKQEKKLWKTAGFSVFKVSQAACKTSQPRLYRN